jgi:hypothetical protein
MEDDCGRTQFAYTTGKTPVVRNDTHLGYLSDKLHKFNLKNVDHQEVRYAHIAG